MTRRLHKHAALRRQRCVELAARPGGVTINEVRAALYLSHAGAHYVLSTAAADYGMAVVSVPCRGGHSKRYFTTLDAAERWARRWQDGGMSVDARGAEPGTGAQADAEPYAVASGRAALHPVPPVPGWGRPPVRRTGADDHRRYPHSFGGTPR